MHLKMTMRKIEDISILDLEGRVILGAETSILRETVKDRLERDEKKILLNLARVSYLDSSGLGTLVGCLASANQAHAQIKLVNLDGKVHDVLRVTRLHTAFEVFNDEAAAIRSFSGEQKSTAVGA